MSDKLVVLAAYSLPVEVQLARARLEAEGIKAFLTGGESVDVFGGVQGVGGLVQLWVLEADAERAAEILTAHAEGQADDAGPEDDAALWVCPLCGDAVSDELSVCPSCETERPAPRKSPAVTARPPRNPASRDVQEEPPAKPDQVTSDTPLEAVPTAVDDDLDLPNLETFVGDDLVRRAFLSALFPVLIPYSFRLLVRLAFYSGKVSPRMMPRLYWTIAIDAFWCLLLLLFVARLIGLLLWTHRF